MSRGEVVILLTRYESLGKTVILVCQRGGEGQKVKICVPSFKNAPFDSLSKVDLPCRTFETKKPRGSEYQTFE